MCIRDSTDFVLDALEQALYARQPERDSSLIHHSDRGSQYVSIRYSERLAEAGVEPSVGSKGDSYDNALAETINGLSTGRVDLALALLAERIGRRNGYTVRRQNIWRRLRRRLAECGRHMGAASLRCCKRRCCSMVCCLIVSRCLMMAGAMPK